LNLALSQDSFAVGDWLVEPAMNRISTASETVHLRAQLMDVLVYLANLEGQVATLESIHDDLWAGKVVSSGTIYNCVAELRQAFARSGSKTEYIETLPKKGYRLAPPIVTLPSAGISPPSTASIAILPLHNRSNDPDIEYLCDGIADEILYGLSKIDGLIVYSANSLKNERLDTRVVGLRFGAQKVLSGSLQVMGNKMRALFKLEKVSDGTVVWSERFDQTIDDLFELQDKVADQVIEAISPALPARRLKHTPEKGAGTKSVQALNAFLLGKYSSNTGTLESMNTAIGHFEQAVLLDSQFARAHYLLYLANYFKSREYGDQLALDQARDAADKAEKLGFKAAVPWVHIHRRLYAEQRLSSQELALEAIDKLKSGDRDWGSFAYEQLSWVLSDAGLFEATLDFAKRMLLSPEHNFEDSDAHREIPCYTAACGDLDEAIRLLSILIQREPTDPYLRCERSTLYARTGQFHYAALDVQAITPSLHKAVSRAFLAFYQDDEKELADQHEKITAIPDAHPSHRLWSCCMVGELDKGLAEYVQAAQGQFRSFIDFGNLRARSRANFPEELVARIEHHPRFLELMEATGITEAWQSELIERLNEVTKITGITVRHAGAPAAVQVP
jgi:TolB-like protein